MKLRSNSVNTTIKYGREFAESLNIGDVVCLEGDLGAGKTHFVKGVASYFGINEEKVNSPTFTLINEYSGDIPIYHFDCYRIKSFNEAIEIGIEEYLYGDGVSIIEWPSKIKDLIPDNAIKIEIKHTGASERSILISNR
ncbi:MAG TPA: tRNA (adenosine(37)-N6)-threonylcarbamoyltransferase complex ATPase subunit type 1 TsaE [Balneola sp.]|jgi:tRNA threonylcarbamoyladenosine biosynthesis protein TsaE|nr:tRNA (adenosine(37)-N6)-threonylcarbamoyltransferase complex ATPase subunit type 1 TsaE [Balneola sp.]MAO76373.1 tRNA (adenosine(37)-N6)-threonylcarbamoyltransferase complex ATPase subunit type 1 TsaE [Balneola sp.]MBF65564.1 tRNA (adenosine(37)-N6)-threonylcarbamoyltransferase complex ATPase subunit type 1 TsaE [Balneola sp.]HAH51698.1 tRNA (adenosine(37)-N6)-threonylcarbamoyltransferase complex ATPase subunit type 1 TsaE [Balneola sp.]HAW80464.1 tRNA (adenosine(37)-N6)-threonylcarbamoyltra|tara:strand:+ start:57705 stop:58121 length:417 start_codon:yes stop_codon:yes gene_type:complete